MQPCWVLLLNDRKGMLVGRESNTSMHVYTVYTTMNGEVKPGAQFRSSLHLIGPARSKNRSVETALACSHSHTQTHTGIHICKLSWTPIHQGTIAGLLKNRQQSPSERMKSSRACKERGGGNYRNRKIPQH